jgi:Protein of unknown function (DUF4031)
MAELPGMISSRRAGSAVSPAAGSVHGQARGAVRQGESLPDHFGAENGGGACEGPRRRGVYVDAAIWEWRGLKWSHLLADDIDDLHRFAARLGIHRASYQGPPRTSVPHYDLTSYERQRAIALGAIACSREEIVAIARRSRRVLPRRS